MNFVDLPPLMPDSTRIATVGSFGIFNKLPKNSYRYELYYSKNGNTRSTTKKSEKDNIEWWGGTAEFYRLVYDFEIK